MNFHKDALTQSFTPSFEERYQIAQSFSDYCQLKNITISAEILAALCEFLGLKLTEIESKVAISSMDFLTFRNHMSSIVDGHIFNEIKERIRKDKEFFVVNSTNNYDEGFGQVYSKSVVLLRR